MHSLREVDKEQHCHRRAVCYNVRRMKPSTILVLSLASLLPLPMAMAADGEGKKPTKTHRIVNRVAATVNGRPITASEVRVRLAPYVRELMILYPQQGPRFAAELVKAKKQAIAELIDRELVLSEFESRGYSITSIQVDEEISRRILMQFNGNREAFLDNLRRSGMTHSEYRDSVRKEMMVAGMRATLYERDIPPTPDEIRDEYQRCKSDFRDISQDSIVYDKIFIPSVIEEDPSITPEMQYALAKEVAKKIEDGDISFADAAREYSRDRHAEDGGRWPSIKRCDLEVEFSHIVFSAERGKVMGPLADAQGFGFTIVRVVSKKLAPAPPLSRPEIKEQVDNAVRRKQSEKTYRAWVERLRARSIIRTFI